MDITAISVVVARIIPSSVKKAAQFAGAQGIGRDRGSFAK